jgi:ribosomal protein S18 acetylase RimI-like enzyme
MESFFGADFSDVQVHSGPEASSIGALAFTQGSNIYFAPGQYNPNSHFGQQLLAHELTHVVQQRAGRVRNPFGSGIAAVQDPTLEAEAERMGRQAAMHVLRVQAKMTPRQTPAQTSSVHLSDPMKVREGSYKITAQDKGRPVGSVMIHKRGRTVEVTDLGVEAGHRRKGFGEKLISSALRTGLRLGLKRVKLDVGDSGTGRLTKWYRQMGFRQTGLDQRGRPHMEALVRRVLSGVGQGKLLRQVEEPDRILAGMRGAVRKLAREQAKDLSQTRPLLLTAAGYVLQRASESKAQASAASVDIVPLVTWLKAKDPGSQKSNFSVGLTADGCLIISKVGGITKKSRDMVAGIAAYVQEAYPKQQVYLAKKFNKLSPSGNHAEMCVVATARALGKTLTQVTCTHPNCRFCSTMMTFLNIVGNSITKGDPGSQATWCHPIVNAAFGTTFNSDEDTCLKALQLFNAALAKKQAEKYQGEGKLDGGAYYGGTISVKKTEKVQ